MTNQTYYPPPKFYFSVSLLGTVTSSSSTTIDSSFQEVSGIEVEFGTEEVAEGGENRYVHRLPKQAKAPPLVLKRGVVTQSSSLGQWVASTLGSNLTTQIVPQSLNVQLLGPNDTVLITWQFYNAWPLKWTTAALNSTENEVLTESLEFSYSYFVRTTTNASSK